MKKGFRIFLTLFLLLSILPVSSLADEPDAGTGFKVTAERDGNNWNAEVRVPADAEGCQLLIALYEANGKLITVKSKETSGAGTYQAQFPNAPENVTVRAFLLSEGNKPRSGVAPATAKYLTVGAAQRVSEGVYRLTGGEYQNVIIPESIGNGDVTLENVIVTGKLIVLGGGSNSIHLDSCSVDAIQVNKDVTAQDAEQPRIELKNTPVEKIEAVQPVIIEADSESAVQTVEAKSDVTVQGARIETVTVPENVTTKPVITVTSGTVSTVEAKSETVVSGAENTVANVKAEAPVEVASETVVTVTVTVQVTVTVTGNSDVEVAVETTEAVKIAAESAQVSVSTTQTAEVSVQVNNTAVGYIHKWRETGRTDATCKTEGSVTYSCSCEGTCELGGTKTETLAKLPHKEVIDEAVPATCTADGLTAGKHCSECGEVLIAQQTVPATGHKKVIDAAVAATCTESGLTEGKHCFVCGEVLIAQQTIPATGHSFAAAWSCDETDHWHAATCGHTDEVSGKAEHTWDDGVESDNEMVYTCTVCGHTRTEPLKQPAVRWSETGVLSWDAVEGATGYIVRFKHLNSNQQYQSNSFYATTNSFNLDWQLAYFNSSENAEHIVEVAWISDGKKTFLEDSLKISVNVSGETSCTVTVDNAAKGWFTVDFGQGGNYQALWKHSDTTNYYGWGDLLNWHYELHNDGMHAIEPGDTFSAASVISRSVTDDTLTLNMTKQYVLTVPADNTDAATYEQLAEALTDETVTGIRITADITVPAQDRWTVLTVGKPVYVAAGKTLTVAGHETDGEKFGFLANDLTIVEGGSLTLEEGAVLKTAAIMNGENEPFYRYTGRVCVAGGKLDVSEGSVAKGSFLNYSYAGSGTDSNALILGANTPEIEFSVRNEAQLRAAIADEKCTGGVIVEDDVTLTDDLTVTKLVLVNEQKTLTVPAEKTLTVDVGGFLQVSGTLNVYGTLNNKGEIFNLKFIDVLGGTLSNSGTINGDWFPAENGEFFCNSNIGIEGGATLTNSGTINDCVVAADYYHDGEDAKLCELPEGLQIAEKIAVAFDAEQTKRCLALPGYDVVVPVGNVDLGDVTIPAGKMLRVKNSVFDGKQTYEGNSVTVKNLTAEGGNRSCGGIDVLSGGSLTVTGALTLATSSWEHRMDDAGYIQVMQGGSLTVGGVEYVGKNGALTLDAGSSLVLNGLPLDVAKLENRTGIFAFLLGNAAVEEERTFTVLAAWDNFIIQPDCTLSVCGTLTNNGSIENRGEIEVRGTLANHGGIANQNTIFVFGGKLENHGKIDGERQTDENRWQSIISIENGGRLESDFAGASIHDYIEAVDSWYDDKTVKCSWDEAFDPASGDFEVMAVAFGTEQIQAALDATSTWGEHNEHPAHTYECVIACGTDTAGTDGSPVNTVKLGGITVNPYQKLRLCNWIAGSDLYCNDYVIGAGDTLTLSEGAGLECYNSGSRTLTIDGEIVNNGGYIDFGGMTIAGEKIIHNEDELAAALENGGTFYLHPLAREAQTDVSAAFGNPDGTDFESQYHLDDACTIGKNTTLVALGGEPIAVFFDGGFTVSRGADLSFSGLNLVAGADSRVYGTVHIGGNAQLVVQGARGATLTNNGIITVGGPDISFWNAALSAYQGGNILVNNGTINVYGDLWFSTDPEIPGFTIIEDNGTINYLFIAEVDSREALLTAMDDIVIRNVIFTGDVTLYSGDHIKGRGLQYVILENVTVTLEKGEKDEPVFLDQGSDMKVYGKLIANHTLYAYSGIRTPENEPREKHLIYDFNIHFLKNFADFGEFVCNAVGDRLEVTDADIRGYGDQGFDNWPGGEWNEGFFALLVKYGGVQPRTDEENADRVYWPTWEPITYGDAMAILGNVWKAICGAEKPLPEGVCLEYVLEQEHLDDERCNALLGAFAVALPRQEDARTEITLIRDNVNSGDAYCGNDGMTISGKTFMKHVTINCDPRYLQNGDDFGGDINFVNCAFPQGVTVKMTGGVGYNLRLNNSCTGAVKVVTPEGTFDGRTNVSFSGINGMNFDTTGAFANFFDLRHDDTVSFTLNGLTITDEDDGYFELNARYDNWGDHDTILTVDILTRAQSNTVTVSGSGFGGKLRVGGTIDVSKLTLGEGGFLEMGDTPGADITLGGNTIRVNDYNGGSYSFSGTGEVYVPNGNQYAMITVNDVNLGTPHIFGEHSDGIYLGLTDPTGVTFKLEQGTWDGENNCVSEWTEIEYFNAVLYNDDGPVDENNTKPATKLHLERDGDNPWINDPYQVKLTVTVGGCTVVYDTIMWKPLSETEFAERLNQRLGTDYAFETSGRYLTYGKAKEMLSTAWKTYANPSDMPDLREIIRDGNYWGQWDDWNSQHDGAADKDKWLEENEGRNPDYWTCDWNFANDAIRNLRAVLGIKDTYGDVTLHLFRDNSGFENVNLVDSKGDWHSFDGNWVSDAKFTGTVTLVCDTECSEDNNWGGCVFFENCDFEDGVIAAPKQGINYGIRFYGCTGVETGIKLTLRDGENTLAPLTLGGSRIALDVRYDENGRDEDGDRIYIATADVRGESKNEGESAKAVTVSGRGFGGKLRISGTADVSGMSFTGNGRLELSNNGDSSIELGSNAIRVNDDCGCSYSFTGTGKVTVCNQNQYADIMVNGKHLGTPHIFGRGGFGIFFPLTGSEGVSFKVEQGRWNEDKQCAEDWRTLEYTVETKEDGSGIHLNPVNVEQWITDPYQVRVTVTFADGCAVVYDTIMWKPIHLDEFVAELNTRFNKDYTLDNLGITDCGDGDHLTFGVCKTAFAAIWKDFGKTEPIDMNRIINDGGYWDELARWERDYQNALDSGDENRIGDMENRSPDNWTRRWNDLDEMLDALTEALGIS